MEESQLNFVLSSEKEQFFHVDIVLNLSTFRGQFAPLIMLYNLKFSTKHSVSTVYTELQNKMFYFSYDFSISVK